VNIIDRILQRIKINQETGCWEWQGAHANEYGVVGYGKNGVFGRRRWYAHRLMFTVKNGEIPRGLCVCIVAIIHHAAIQTICFWGPRKTTQRIGLPKIARMVL
jgi:hypothetical protein